MSNLRHDIKSEPLFICLSLLHHSRDIFCNSTLQNSYFSLELLDLHHLLHDLTSFWLQAIQVAQDSSSHLFSLPLASFSKSIQSVCMVAQRSIAAVAPPSEGSPHKFLIVVDCMLYCIEGISVALFLIPRTFRLQIPFAFLFDKLADGGLAEVVEEDLEVQTVLLEENVNVLINRTHHNMWHFVKSASLMATHFTCTIQPSDSLLKHIRLF